MDIDRALHTDTILKFASHVVRKEYDLAMATAIEMFTAMEAGGNYLRTTATEEEVRQVQTLFASSLTAMIADPEFSLNNQGFSALMANKCHMRQIFRVSGFRDMSHLFKLLEHSEGQSRLLKYMVACTLDVAGDTALDIVRTLDDTEARFLFWLSFLDTRYVLRNEEQAFIRQILPLATEFTECRAKSVAELGMINRVWMYCSYWDLPHKHEIKKTLNQVLINTGKLLGAKIPQKLPAPDLTKQPRVLVITEIWKTNSAMYRCYAGAIQKLKPYFHLTLLGMRKQSDENSEQIFDEVDYYTSDEMIGDLVERVRKFKPDLIYYPSLGMALTPVWLSLYRLAPVQVMTLGHPATTFSNEVDFVCQGEDEFHDPDVFSEKVLLLKRGALSLTRPSVHLEPAEIITKPKVLNISVNSTYFKLSPAFINLCQEIQSAAEVPVHFHFLVGLYTFNFPYVSKLIGDKLNASFYEMLPYEHYSQVMQQCALQLTPFPFGNTNSFVDAMILGIPTVCLDGSEPHSHFDTVLSERVGLPDLCRAKTRSDYKKAALQLINDESLRISITKDLRELDLDKVLFGSDLEEDAAGDLGEAFKWLLHNRDEIRAADRQVWSLADRSALPLPASVSVESS